ncbi:MAG: alpha/beta fold hydrolase, partial [Myxococcaceae bacterium]
AALTEAGIDTFCLDWGISGDEDRYLTWEHVLARLARALRVVRRKTGARQVSLLGYCMGATVAGIQAALEPEGLAGFVNLLGPFDFSKAGILGTLVGPRVFDVEAIALAGNVSPEQMQAGFTLLRPTAPLAKWVGFLDRGSDPAFREGFEALEAWASDNVPFPAAAYVTYIKELYQQNLLVQGKHRVGGRAVDLKNLRCPVLTVVAEKDVICPPEAAQALNQTCGSADERVIRVPGGHVGAVVGGKAASVLYPQIAKWLKERTCN